jgi:cold shock CspA family protein
VPGKGCGFLATEDGLEVYFHRNSVLQPGFESLQPGSLVTFVEERGEKGPQASSVRPRKVRRASAQGRPLAIAVP